MLNISLIRNLVVGVNVMLEREGRDRRDSVIGRGRPSGRASSCQEYDGVMKSSLGKLRVGGRTYCRTREQDDKDIEHN